MNYYLAFWNLENLFDTETAKRPAWLQAKLKHELKGWNDEVLSQKLSQLASIIVQLNDGRGPDILGVCEVENATVLKKLVRRLKLKGRRYGIVHDDSGDQRGIDVAFIYDKRLFTPHEKFSHVVLKRNATRDIFQVNFKTKQGGRPLVLIGNHWPSRSGGEEPSRPYRALAAETLAYWISLIPEHLGKDVPIVAMGDFNDEPFDASMTQYLRADRDAGKVLRARTERLYNLGWKALGEGVGTHYYGGPRVLDQIVVNKSLLTGAGGFQLSERALAGMTIERFEGMSRGTTGAPIRFGRPRGTEKFVGRGFSDHLPVSVVVDG